MEPQNARSRSSWKTLLRRSPASRAGLFLERLAPARLWHEEPPRAHLQSEERTHGDACGRSRLFPGSDHGLGAHRSLDCATAAAMRRAVLHARHPALADPGRLAEADGAARERRSVDPARGIVRRAD